MQYSFSYCEHVFFSSTTAEKLSVFLCFQMGDDTQQGSQIQILLTSTSMCGGSYKKCLILTQLSAYLGDFSTISVQ